MRRVTKMFKKLFHMITDTESDWEKEIPTLSTDELRSRLRDERQRTAGFYDITPLARLIMRRYAEEIYRRERATDQ